MKEWILEETMVDLQEVKRSELQLYNEYLIEIVKGPSGKRYHAKVYELVADGPPFNNPQAALERAVSFLTRSSQLMESK